LIAYRVSYDETPGDRMIWLDGRPHPSAYAEHSWEGFSTGKFDGDTLVINATHIKEGFTRRNGVPSSFRATVVEHISLDEPYMTWVVTTFDPDYLTEPLVRSVTYIRAPTVQIPPYPCAAQQEEYRPEDIAGKYRVPNFLIGENPFLSEVSFKYQVPLEGVRGGGETLYPEWRTKGMSLTAPNVQAKIVPTYSDESSRIAERADAQPKRAPAYDKVEPIHVNGNVYLLGGAGANLALSVGGDGIVMVDSGAGPATDKVVATIQQINQVMKPDERPNSASPFANTWQSTHTFAPTAVRMILNTSANPDHVGGNEKMVRSEIFHPIGVEGVDELASEVIFAHENVARRMTEAKLPQRAIPSNTYFSDKYTVHRFINGEAVQLLHLANAVTDGDSAVWFRKSDVIVTGDVYNSDIYPPIDTEKGGSIDGEIAALNRLADMCVTEYMAEGGTMIVPAHGWVSDAADLGYYRDMMVIIRNRMQSMIDKGMTLQQIKAAKPTMDYDPLYGREPGVTSQFVEAVYRSLTQKKAAK
jgi:glyoxylase-like metal-dependent hydrolase (beta-lactamase superfamily II)